MNPIEIGGELGCSRRVSRLVYICHKQDKRIGHKTCKFMLKSPAPQVATVVLLWYDTNVIWYGKYISILLWKIVFSFDKLQPYMNFKIIVLFWYTELFQVRLYLQLFVGGWMSYLYYLCLLGSSLHPAVCRRVYVLFILFMFVRFVFTSSCL